MYSKQGAVIDRREMLRVKVKSLADEARIIRFEERRSRGQLQEELRRHRVWNVRDEARATHLAYGLIRGRSAEQIERPKVNPPETFWKKVRAMVEKYGPVDTEAKAKLMSACQ